MVPVLNLADLNSGLKPGEDCAPLVEPVLKLEIVVLKLVLKPGEGHNPLVAQM